MRREIALGAAAAVLIAAPLLLWPAVFNGYPLLFGDTGVYIKDGIDHHVSWARPMFYGLFMLPLHLLRTTWPVVVAQAVIAASVLLGTMRGFLPRLHPLALIPITLVLAVGTSLPWFVSQLMPDLFAGLLVLVLAALLLLPPALPRIGQPAAALFAAGCITMHLSLLPISLALIVTLLVCRFIVRRSLRLADIVRGGVVPAIAAAVLIGTNALLIGQASMSPYGKIFLLNRVLVDGPGVRALQRECPRPDWTLCAFKEEIPTIRDEDDILWGSNAVLDRAGGYKVVAPQAWPIIMAAARAEPGTLLRQALENTARQFISFRSGDALLRPSTFNDGVWSAVFPAAEQARYRAGRQYGGLTLVPAWLQRLHIVFGAVAIVAVAAGAVVALRRREPLGGLLAAVTMALLTNAFVAGALSGVYDRYQSRFVWLAPFALLLMMAARWQRERPPRSAGEDVRRGAFASGGRGPYR